ncbi:MAG: sulfatase-like hydrolase/transferase [Planctomycetota bacterium]|nr:MAG: sulfatase-like hydrolase/transferase [Planctomycetota bacterium]
MEGNQDGSRPNIVVMVSDDQGYADISCYDHPKEVSTPNIDRLAEQGVRFTSGYASAYVCAPTRAGLLTGRYQQRFGFYTASDSRTGMPLSEITVADVLKKEGYATGVFGKWHLGIEPEYHPMKRGFDEFYGFLGHGAHDYFNLKRTDAYTSIYRNEEIIDDTGYLTDNLGREAVSFIERHHKRPFFLYLPFNAVHWPLQAPEGDIKRFDTGDKERDILMAMLGRMDSAVGRVLEALARSGADKNTLIFYFSDNGGAKRNKSNNGVLRDYKHSVYEGGLRVPFLVSWPGKLPKGEVCSEPVICLDIMPTICAAVGVKLPDGRIYDGKNMLPLLVGEAKGPLHEALFWDGGKRDGKWAVRMDRWKLLKDKGDLELYDLEADIGEKNDRAGRHPEIVKRLQRRYTDWRKQMAPQIKRAKRGKREANAVKPRKR